MNRLNAMVLALMLMGLAAPAAGAGALEAGNAAMHKHDYAAAVEIFGPLAETGNAVAQFNLGVLFDEGHGVPQNYLLALKWYTRAASQGLIEAQYLTSYYYRRGRGIQQDTVKAHMWINLAASGGLPHADVERLEQQREMTRARIATAQALAVKWLASHPRPWACPKTWCPRPRWLPKDNWYSPFYWYGL